MKIIKNLTKKIKNMDAWDISATKLASMAFILFVITIWPTAMNWVHSVNPWYFLIAMILFSIKPIYKVWIMLVKK